MIEEEICHGNELRRFQRVCTSGAVEELSPTLELLRDWLCTSIWSAGGPPVYCGLQLLRLCVACITEQLSTLRTRFSGCQLFLGFTYYLHFLFIILF